MKNCIYILSLLLFVSLSAFAQKKEVHISELPNTINNYTPIFDQLQNNEQIKLSKYSRGCFHNSKEILTFGKENDTYYVIFDSKKKVLSNTEINAFRKFENVIPKQQNLFCTTTDTYVIVYNGATQTIKDGSCSWTGYKDLKEALVL